MSHQGSSSSGRPSIPLPFTMAVVCASNQNRSMAAMKRLHDHGFTSVGSYGTGTKVSLPGPNPYEPNIYNFGVPYREMYDQLRAKDEQLYTKNGVLQMLDRNARTAPERWQDEKAKMFDVVITYEERVFDALMEDMEERGAPRYFRPLHVLGLDVKDNHVEAEVGATHSVLLTQSLLELGENWDDQIETMIDRFCQTTGKEVTYGVAFY